MQCFNLNLSHHPKLPSIMHVELITLETVPNLEADNGCIPQTVSRVIGNSHKPSKIHDSSTRLTIGAPR